MAKITVGGQEYEGEFVPFNSIREDWNEYRVGDFIVKAKLVVSEVFQVKDQVDQMGNPVFLLQWNTPTFIRKAQQ